MVSGFTSKIEKFVGKFLTNDSETAEETKVWLVKGQKTRKEAGKAAEERCC